MDQKDSEFGSGLKKYATPEFLAKERRNNIFGLGFGVVLGVAAVVEALYARGHGGMVAGGPQDHFLAVPWWVVASVGLFVLGGSLYGLWKTLKHPD